MNRTDKEFKGLIYDLMNGSLDLEHYPVEESKYVENEFAEGKECSRLYEGAFEAGRRICERLGKPDDEDRDVEIIMGNLLDICRVLSMRMYDYGQFFSENKI